MSKNRETWLDFESVRPVLLEYVAFSLGLIWPIGLLSAWIAFVRRKT